MALPVSNDILIGFGAIIVAIIAIYAFVRATGGLGSVKSSEARDTKKEFEPVKLEIEASKKAVKVPRLEPITKSTEVERARSAVRKLTLRQEIISLVMKRLFEAEDEGEITPSERIELSNGYEKEMKEIDEELKKAELIVSLNELETIRADIITKFEETLSETQQRINLIIKELKIEPPKDKEQKPEAMPRPIRRVKPRKIEEFEEEEPEEEEDEEEVEGEEGGEKRRRSRQDVEDRLDKLKEDVLKELEELDRLELEA